MGCDRKLSKINLYRILQESLQNCNKYANATLVELKEKRFDVLSIRDNGVGFNIKSKRKGLQNMISRTKVVTDHLIFFYSREGSTICVTIPIVQIQIPI
jgi:signal transduction histidine kinase